MIEGLQAAWSFLLYSPEIFYSGWKARQGDIHVFLRRDLFYLFHRLEPYSGNGEFPHKGQGLTIFLLLPPIAGVSAWPRKWKSHKGALRAFDFLSWVLFGKEQLRWSNFFHFPADLRGCLWCQDALRPGWFGFPAVSFMYRRYSWHTKTHSPVRLCLVAFFAPRRQIFYDLFLLFLCDLHGNNQHQCRKSQ